MRQITKPWIVVACMLPVLWISRVSAQMTYPEAFFNQSYVPSSPNGVGAATYGDQPVSLSSGSAAISIPIFVVNCGSLKLPVSLSYQYNGLFPLLDAGWVGLGWNLNAGGMITREVEGGVDNSENSGYNYGQYNLADSITSSPDPNNFWGGAYNNLLGNSAKAYDLAPDIFDAEFNGYSDKFIWVSGKAYMMTWNKDFGVSWPSPTSNITVTTADGTIYIFSSGESTTNYYYGGEDSTHQTYTSAWNLSSIVSADHKDTILLTYATYSWQQAAVSYQTNYVKSDGSQADIGPDSLGYDSGPSVSASVLQSIQCRNYRVQFVQDTAARTDISGNYPRLRGINVIDSLTGDTIKKNVFSPTNILAKPRLAPPPVKDWRLKRSAPSIPGFRRIPLLIFSNTSTNTEHFPVKQPRRSIFGAIATTRSTAQQSFRRTAADTILLRHRVRVWAVTVAALVLLFAASVPWILSCIQQEGILHISMGRTLFIMDPPMFQGREFGFKVLHPSVIILSARR